MLNTVTVVGRITKITKGLRVIYLDIAVPRPYKNENGEYESDTLYVKIKYNIPLKLEKGDLVGVKGRLENINDDIVIVAEKTTFLSRKEK